MAYADWLRGKGIRPGGIDLPDWSPSAALKFMDGHGIATGVLSVSTPGVHLGDDAEARKWAREVNEYTADLVRADPGRFGLFATLTLPDVEGAIAEAGYALDTLHADGVVLLANNAGRYLGDPGFAPLLAYLHSRQAIVFVHPGELPAEPVPGIPSFTADFLLDTTRTAISLILSGAMKKYHGIKFILAHAGGFVPYIAYRILLTMVSQENKAPARLTPSPPVDPVVLVRRGLPVPSPAPAVAAVALQAVPVPAQGGCLLPGAVARGSAARRAASGAGMPSKRSVASAVRGVYVLQNHIRLTPTPDTGEVRQDISEAFRRNASLDADRLDRAQHASLSQGEGLGNGA